MKHIDSLDGPQSEFYTDERDENIENDHHTELRLGNILHEG
jgi:hypothetical protein